LTSELILNAVAYHKKLQLDAVASFELSDGVWEKILIMKNFNSFKLWNFCFSNEKFIMKEMKRFKFIYCYQKL
jgi:hypothetical protein